MMLLTVVVVVVLPLVAVVDATLVATAQNGSAGGLTFNPMTDTPQQTFSTPGRVDSDRHWPDYLALASPPDGRHLLLVDHPNKKVKVMDVSTEPPRVTSYVTLSKTPWELALLPDGMVAVTTWGDRYIYLLSLQGDVISVTSRFRARRSYQGVTAGLANDTLLVTSRDYFDVITRSGQILQSYWKWQFSYPDYLCSAGGDDVIASDWASGELFRINARTGRVVDTLSPPGMETPHQAVMDKGGNLWVASRGSESVMVMSPDGEWRTLLEEEGYATGISVTTDRVFVTWSGVTMTADSDYTFASVVRAYSMTSGNQ